MSITIHILKFIAIALLGFFSVSGMVVLSLYLGIIDALPADEHLYHFKLVYGGGGMAAFILGLLLGVASFFTQGRTSTAFLVMPLALPVCYSIAALIYFSTL